MSTTNGCQLAVDAPRRASRHGIAPSLHVLVGKVWQTSGSGTIPSSPHRAAQTAGRSPGLGFVEDVEEVFGHGHDHFMNSSSASVRFISRHQLNVAVVPSPPGYS